VPVLRRALDTLRRVYRAATAPPPPRARPRAPAVYGPNPEALPVARRNVEKIRTAAMSGRLRIWALPDLYTEETPEIRRMYRPMLGRALVKSALGKKVLAVCSQEVQVQPEDQDDPRCVAQADFLQYALSRIGSPAAGAKTYNHVGASKLVWDLFLPGLIDGWALGEGVWAPGPVPRGKWRGKRLWCDFHGKDTHGLHPMIDAFKGVEGVKAGAYNAGQVLTGEDFADCVLWVNWPLFESPTGLSDLRSIVRPVWIEDTCWKLRGLHLEQYTGPYLKGQYTTPDVRQALEQALAEARGGGWITVPEGALVDAIDLSMRGTQDWPLRAAGAKSSSACRGPTSRCWRGRRPGAGATRKFTKRSPKSLNGTWPTPPARWLRTRSPPGCWARTSRTRPSPPSPGAPSASGRCSRNSSWTPG
jgi:hypothetical protein